jgi:hypothetical protein
MKIKTTNDAEAIKWLCDLKEGSRGKFRIHTNKDGYRLYLKFEDENILGFGETLIRRWIKSAGRWPMANSVQFREHPHHKETVATYYAGTETGSEIYIALNKHLARFPFKKVLVPSRLEEEIGLAIGGEYLYQGTLSEFLAETDEDHQ